MCPTTEMYMEYMHKHNSHKLRYNALVQKTLKKVKLSNMHYVHWCEYCLIWGGQDLLTLSGRSGRANTKCK